MMLCSQRPQGRGFIAPRPDFPQLAHALLHGVALELQNMGLSHLSYSLTRFPASFPTISHNFPQAGNFLAGGRNLPDRRRRRLPDVGHGSHEGQATSASVPRWGESSTAQHARDNNKGNLIERTTSPLKSHICTRQSARRGNTTCLSCHPSS